MVLLVGSYPTQIYVLYYNITAFQPWAPYSWAKVHGSGWDTIYKYPSSGTVFFDRWIQVTAGFIMFLFFGFGKDATLMYRGFLLKLGFGRWFPRLEHPHLTGFGSGQRSTGAKGSSMGSRGRMVFRKKSEDTVTTLTASEDWFVNFDS